MWTLFSNIPGTAEERGSIYTVLAPLLTLSYVEWMAQDQENRNRSIVSWWRWFCRAVIQARRLSRSPLSMHKLPPQKWCAKWLFYSSLKAFKDICRPCTQWERGRGGEWLGSPPFFPSGSGLAGCFYLQDSSWRTCWINAPSRSAAEGSPCPTEKWQHSCGWQDPSLGLCALQWWTKAPARCLKPTEAMSPVPLPVGSPSEGNRVKVAEGLCTMGLWYWPGWAASTNLSSPKVTTIYADKRSVASWQVAVGYLGTRCAPGADVCVWFTVSLSFHMDFQARFWLK